MAVTGLRRRALYFTDAVVSTTMTQRLSENLLYTIRDAGFPQYEEGDPLPDGRLATANDPLRHVRRFGDELQHHWQEVYVPGSLLVVDGPWLDGQGPQTRTSPSFQRSLRTKGCP
jgi:hypothetical protein